jgi:hypothetical protein
VRDAGGAPVGRRAIAGAVRRAGELEARAVAHLEAALGKLGE